MKARQLITEETVAKNGEYLPVFNVGPDVLDVASHLVDSPLRNGDIRVYYPQNDWDGQRYNSLRPEEAQRALTFRKWLRANGWNGKDGRVLLHFSW